MNGFFFQHFSKVNYKIWVAFCLKTLFYSQQIEHMFFLKTLPGTFKIALRLRDRHVFMSQFLEILNVFNALTLKQIFWKMQVFFKKTGVTPFSWNTTTQHFHTELLCQKPILTQIEWGVQNGPITKNRVLPVTTFFFENFVSV